MIGVGDQPPHALPAAAREALAHYEHVSLADEAAVLAALRGLARHARIDQVECLWEPYMMLAARMREAFGLPGHEVDADAPFRDKERMKQALDAAGIRTPRHRAHALFVGVRGGRGADRLPADLKPVAGAGSENTFRIESLRSSTEVLARPAASANSTSRSSSTAKSSPSTRSPRGGEILYESVSGTVRARCGRSVEWISPQTVSLREHDAPRLEEGRELGRNVLRR